MCIGRIISSAAVAVALFVQFDPAARAQATSAQSAPATFVRLSSATSLIDDKSYRGSSLSQILWKLVQSARDRGRVSANDINLKAFSGVLSYYKQHPSAATTLFQGLNTILGADQIKERQIGTAIDPDGQRRFLADSLNTYLNGVDFTGKIATVTDELDPSKASKKLIDAVLQRLADEDTPELQRQLVKVLLEHEDFASIGVPDTLLKENPFDRPHLKLAVGLRTDTDDAKRIREYLPREQIFGAAASTLASNTAPIYSGELAYGIGGRDPYELDVAYRYTTSRAGYGHGLSARLELPGRRKNVANDIHRVLEKLDQNDIPGAEKELVTTAYDFTKLATSLRVAALGSYSFIHADENPSDTDTSPAGGDAKQYGGGITASWLRSLPDHKGLLSVLSAQVLWRPNEEGNQNRPLLLGGVLAWEDQVTRVRGGTPEDQLPRVARWTCQTGVEYATLTAPAVDLDRTFSLFLRLRQSVPEGEEQPVEKLRGRYTEYGVFAGSAVGKHVRDTGFIGLRLSFTIY